MNTCQNCQHAIDRRHALESRIETLQQQLAEKEEENSALQKQIQNGFQLGREFEREKLGREQARLEERKLRSPTKVFDFPGEAVADPAIEEDKSSKSTVTEDKSVEESLEEALEVLCLPDEEPVKHNANNAIEREKECREEENDRLRSQLEQVETTLKQVERSTSCTLLSSRLCHDENEALRAQLKQVKTTTVEYQEENERLLGELDRASALSKGLLGELNIAKSQSDMIPFYDTRVK